MSFFEEYINKGITTIAAIKVEAKKELAILEKDISELDLKRNEKKIRYDEISTFLKQSITDKQNQSVVISSVWTDLSEDIKCIAQKIIDELIDGSIPATSITAKILDQDKRRNSIIAIKWLMDQKILTRLGPDIKKGPAWADKENILRGKND